MELSGLTLLIKRQLKENYRIYSISVIVLFGVLSFLFLVVHHWQSSFSGSVQHGIFLIGLFISGGVFTNSMFQELSEPAKGIWLLTIPATQADKMLAAIVMSTILFLFVYVGIFYMADGLYVILTYGFHNSLLDLFSNSFYKFFFLYLLFNAFMLLGSIYFAKHSLIKSLLSIMLLFILFNAVNNAMIEFLIPGMEVTSSVILSSFQFIYQGENIYVELPEKWDVAISIFIYLFLPVIVWRIAWLRLKEKEF